MEFAWFSLAGLVLDVLGVWLVYWYAIPSRGGGAVGLLTKGPNPWKLKREWLLGHLGLGLLTCGLSFRRYLRGLAICAG
jgi:hypothetical protein